MTRDLGAAAVLVAAEALRAACAAALGTPAATVLHETYDRVLAEPVPADMTIIIERIERKVRRAH